VPDLGALERYRTIVDDWPAFRDAVARPLPACVWANPERISAPALHALLVAEGLGPRPIAWRPGAFRLASAEGLGLRWWYLVGLCHAQEEASLVPVALLDPRAGERVLDLCAAPGGKTAQIAFALDNRGTVVANDIDYDRMRALRATLDRLGAANVTVTRADGCNYPVESGPFDRVLVDAPCSGEGTLRRRTRPQASIGRPGEHAGRQRALLRKAAQLCRAGGRIAYSTCTFAPEENEAIVDAVLGDCPQYALRVVPAALPSLVTAEGLTRWDGRSFRDDLRHACRIWPHHNDTGGFFVAVIEKGADPLARERVPLPLRPAPPTAWRSVAGERYGLPEAVWDRYLVHRRTTYGLHLVDRTHEPPSAPDPDSVGLLVVKTRIRYPKLTTVGALLFAPQATRNVVELEPSQVLAHLRRESLGCGDEQRAGCTDTGYVLVRHRGFGLGTGFWDAEARTLRSLFPKRWQGNAAYGRG
jgi:NOL1/NOP2/sun family putative RNA methylase